METTKILQAEHAGVLMVLDQLERAVDATERGVEVPREIFRDIHEFFVVFVDRCHHAKEEAELFPQLQELDSGAIASRLEREHAIGRALAADYGAAVETYTPGQIASLASAARAYARFLREHVELETRELFPIVEHELAMQDGALVEAFERIETERIGAGTHERLHGMIEGLAARIDACMRPAAAAPMT